MYLVYFIIPKIQGFNRAHVTKQHTLLIRLPNRNSSRSARIVLSLVWDSQMLSRRRKLFVYQKCSTTFGHQLKGFAFFYDMVKAEVVYLLTFRMSIRL